MTSIQAYQILNGIQCAAQKSKALASRDITNTQGETKTIVCVPGRRVGWRFGFVRTSRDAIFSWLTA